MSIPEVGSRSRLLYFLKKYFSSVSFSARMTGTQTISNSTWTTMQADTETFTGAGYNTSTYTFTAPFAGIYHFYSGVLWYNMAATIVAPNAVIQGFLKNEGLATEQRYRVGAPTTTANANGDFTADGSILLSLRGGDTVCAQVYYVDAAAAKEQIFGHSDDQYQYSQFYGFKV